MFCQSSVHGANTLSRLYNRDALRSIQGSTYVCPFTTGSSLGPNSYIVKRKVLSHTFQAMNEYSLHPRAAGSGTRGGLDNSDIIAIVGIFASVITTIFGVWLVDKLRKGFSRPGAIYHERPAEDLEANAETSTYLGCRQNKILGEGGWGGGGVGGRGPGVRINRERVISIVEPKVAFRLVGGEGLSYQGK
ncbi:uncharacterized protein H6S33_006667 [Morchella sextelata]|uniref:uncharacterized protein n=1 Tax=Morchella sextelata TaxID=1174677 RepID=UPI001D0420FD|nr:uncharacterized protein H6S33_006667 [Morchella sextelata]KAH0604290.1 hypothetical protein H6S33_006667 [Morchella sextelata]